MEDRASKRALEAYPITMSQHSDNCKEYDSNESDRLTFIEGYHQAEKDNELTWEDMAFIRFAFDALEANIHLGAIKIQPMTKEYYQEVLKYFKDLKEREEK